MLPAVATYCGKEIGSEVYGDDTVPSVCMLGCNHDAMLKLSIFGWMPNHRTLGVDEMGYMMVGIVHGRSTTDSSGLAGLDLLLVGIGADRKCGDWRQDLDEYRRR